MSEPICNDPSSTGPAPNHSTATLDTLNTNITVGNIRAIH